jgi:hypothetical protein
MLMSATSKHVVIVKTIERLVLGYLFLASSDTFRRRCQTLSPARNMARPLRNHNFNFFVEYLAHLNINCLFSRIHATQASLLIDTN